MERRRRLGITDVDPNMPRPDGVEINMHTGEVWIAYKDWVGRQGPNVPED